MANLKYKGSTISPDYYSLANSVKSEVISSYTQGQSGFSNSGSAFNAATSPSGVTILCGDEPRQIRTIDFKNYSTFAMGAVDAPQFYGIKWFKDKFIAVGQNNNIYTADANGSNWTFRSHALYGTQTIQWYDIAVSNNVAVIVGIDGSNRLVTQTSVDGINWIETTPWTLYSSIGNQSSISRTNIMVYDGSRFIIITESSTLLISTDGGATWTSSLGVATAVGFANPGEWRIFYTNSKYVASRPAKFITSANGNTWTLVSDGPKIGQFYETLYHVISINNIYFALSFTKRYFSTDGGISWTIISDAISYNYHRFAYQYNANNILILGVDQNYTATTISSINGIIYNYGTSPAVVTSTIAKNAPLNSIEFDSNIKSLDDGKVDISGYTTADTIYADPSGSLRKLPIGVDGSALTSVSSSPVWALIDYSNATVEQYTTAGSFIWTKPIGVKMVYVHLMAGGGGGGGGAMYSGSSNNAVALGGGGGGAGGFIETFIDPQSLSSTETIVVGSGGAGGTGAYQLGNLNSATGGIDGQNSSFSILNAIGGGGGEGGISIDSPNTIYTVRGGNCGVIPLSGVYNQFISESLIQVDQYYSMGVGGFNTLDFSTPGTVQYGQNNANGKSGRNAPGGGGAGGCYVKLNGSATAAPSGAGGGGYASGILYTNTNTMERKNIDYASLYTTGFNGIEASHNTFPVGNGAPGAKDEGASGNSSFAGPGSGGNGGASGGYTISFSGSGDRARQLHGGGGGGGGGCYALNGANSRAGNGGAGGRGRVIIVCFF
jgi:hypothetical protein